MKIVPAWLPGRLFWTFFVGLCLIAAALSMAWRVRTRLSTILLGSMLFAFVLMIHVPNALGKPGARVLWVVAARDLAFACGALILGMARGKSANTGRAVQAMQLLVATIVVFFGIEHFLYPECVPAVPLAKLIPAWMPLGRLWTYATGAALVAGGVLMFAQRARRIAAAALGTLVVFIVLFFYVPIMIAQPNVESLNFVTDTLVFAGTLLAVASATLPYSVISHLIPKPY